MSLHRSLPDVDVSWIGGGLLLDTGSAAILVDAPVGAAEAVARHGLLHRLHGVVLSSGRMASVRGLLGVLHTLAPHRGEQSPLAVWAPAGEERAPGLVDAWQRGWERRYPVVLDAVHTGNSDRIGPFQVTFAPIQHGEPTWCAEGEVRAAPGAAVQIQVGTTRVVWVPGAAPTPAVRRACRHSDLAAVEVGVVAWPPSDTPWRMTLGDAIDATQDAREVWLVGDDGGILRGAEA